MQRIIPGLVAALLAGACDADVVVESTAPTADVDDGAATPRGIYVVAPRAEALSPTETALARHRVLFLQHQGGTYTPGADDSSANRSSIPPRVATIPPYEGTPAQWQELYACVRAQFARYDVEVTDVDPGAVPHLEAVFGGGPSAVGMGAGVGGVSPMYGDCSVVERSVVYIFTAVFGSVQAECEVAAQEIGHSFGLDHEYLCKDPMTYLSGCGAKTFQDVDARCGEYAARQCMCGGATQSSVQHLLATLGPATGQPPPPPPPPPPPGDHAAPVVAISAPADGATLPAGAPIAITATATDDVAVTRVELLWTQPSGLVTVDCAAPSAGVTCAFAGGSATWRFTVGSGARTLAVRARDAAGNVTTTPARSITLGGAPPVATPPTISLDAPAATLQVRPGGLVAVRATAADDSRVAQVRLTWTAPTATTYYSLAELGGGSWGLDLTLSASAIAGPRTLVVTATDDAGHGTSSAPRAIQVVP